MLYGNVQSGQKTNKNKYDKKKGHFSVFPSDVVSCTFGVNSTVFFSVFQSSHFLEEWVVLSTAARINGHSWVDLQNHVSIRVQEEDTEGIHLVWNATWFRDPWDDSDSSDDTLDGGMIRWMCQLKKSSVEKKATISTED